MATAERNTFPRSQRLSGRRQFAEVFDAKAKFSRGPLTLYAKPNGKGHNRFGLSVSKRIGPAVVRNRFKRLMREAYRLAQHGLPTGYDLVIVPRPHELRDLTEYQSMLTTLITNCDAVWRKKLSQ